MHDIITTWIHVRCNCMCACCRAISVSVQFNSLISTEHYHNETASIYINVYTNSTNTESALYSVRLSVYSHCYYATSILSMPVLIQWMLLGAVRSVHFTAFCSLCAQKCVLIRLIELVKFERLIVGECSKKCNG